MEKEKRKLQGELDIALKKEEVCADSSRNDD
jgi:hypothetical protein